MKSGTVHGRLPTDFFISAKTVMYACRCTDSRYFDKGLHSHASDETILKTNGKCARRIYGALGLPYCKIHFGGSGSKLPFTWTLRSRAHR